MNKLEIYDFIIHFIIGGLIVGVIVIEKQLKAIFDKDGNRKMQL